MEIEPFMVTQLTEAAFCNMPTRPLEVFLTNRKTEMPILVFLIVLNVGIFGIGSGWVKVSPT